MKEKKLKNIIKEVLNEVSGYDSPIKKSMYTGDWAEKDEDVSDKLKTMLLNLLNYRNNINININNSSLSISADNLSGIKKVRTSSSGLIKVSDDDYFSVEIIKGTGFTINKGYNIRTQYLDNKMFDEILPLVTNKLKEINIENFNDFWNVVMKESGLMRDNNIDELLRNINE
jgi:hypothetical protein